MPQGWAGVDLREKAILLFVAEQRGLLLHAAYVEPHTPSNAAGSASATPSAAAGAEACTVTGYCPARAASPNPGRRGGAHAEKLGYEELRMCVAVAGQILRHYLTHELHAKYQTPA